MNTSPLREHYVSENLRNSQSFKVKIENNPKFTFPDYCKSKNEHYATAKSQKLLDVITNLAIIPLWHEPSITLTTTSFA